MLEKLEVLLKCGSHAALYSFLWVHYSFCLKFCCSVHRICMNCKMSSFESDSPCLYLVHQPTDGLKVSQTDDWCETFPLNINTVSVFSCGWSIWEELRPLQKELFSFSLFLLRSFKSHLDHFGWKWRKIALSPHKMFASLSCRCFCKETYS